jgi:hypothetical protein
VSVYLFGFAVLYIAIGRNRWWNLIRIDALCGFAVLFVLDIAYWGKNLADLRRYGTRWGSFGPSLGWLICIVDATLCVLTSAVVILALYSWPKLNQQAPNAGNVSYIEMSWRTKSQNPTSIYHVSVSLFSSIFPQFLVPVSVCNASCLTYKPCLNSYAYSSLQQWAPGCSDARMFLPLISRT